MTAIGYNAFYGTPYYNSFPDGLVYINNVCYKYKGNMPENTKIDIKDGTKSINPYAFEDCTGLTSVTIPNSVTKIGNSAFYGCSGLTNVIIGSSVRLIGEQAFYGDKALESIYISERNVTQGCPVPRKT